jgi:hypothetical protein
MRDFEVGVAVSIRDGAGGQEADDG